MWRRLGELACSALAAAALAGTLYLGFSLAQICGFSRRRRESRCLQRLHDGAAFTPPITIVKPLHGMEPQLQTNLSSFCEQDYPGFQVLFCATDPQDPALAVARAVVERFPSVDAEVVVSDVVGLPNPKIANVRSAEPRIKYDIIAISDADMCVEREYLRTIATPFAKTDVGAVTCLYGGVPIEGVASLLGALFVNDHFTPSVLVARAIEPLSYCFGSTMAVRRNVLAGIGGFQALGATLADDYALGKFVTAAGLRVALAPYVAHSVQGERTIAQLWTREVRWARVIRSERPIGSTLAVVTYAWPLAFAAWLCKLRSRRRCALLAIATVLRLWLHRAARDAFAPSAPLAPHLIPLRDALALAVWAASRLGRSVEWKDRRHRV